MYIIDSSYRIIGVQVSHVTNLVMPNQTVNRLEFVSDLGNSSHTFQSSIQDTPFIVYQYVTAQFSLLHL